MSTYVRSQTIQLRRAVWAALAGASAAATLQPAMAAEDLEEVMVLGSRRTTTVTDTVAPVDIISGEDFKRLGSPEMDNMLRSLVPSYNVSQQPINDESTLIRPANLRGLPPDNTLVLVNGKRRHRAGVINFLGDGVSDGAQGPDVGPIPSIALKSVQVLRDGAAAQYGSDAIAGVINFELKDAATGGSAEARYGEYYKGDGTTLLAAANVGLPLGPNGFANLSFEYNEADATNRSIQRTDAGAIAAAGNASILDPAQVWGQPEIKDSYKFFANTGIDVTDDVALYAFGNYGTREIDGGFYYRNPHSRAGVFGNGSQLLVADTNTANAVSCPTVAVTNDRPNAAALAQISAGGALDAECFAFYEKFPGGFTPRFGGKIEDYSAAFGSKGMLVGDLRYDLSTTYGSSEAEFFICNTVNASLGPNSPTSFNPGANHQTELNFNADFSYPVPVSAFASPLNVAFGAEWRREQFEVTAGDPNSYAIGPYATQGFSSGSNGYSGFSPQSEGKFKRKNIALYSDLEADVTQQLVLGAAVRWEDFDDFGTTTNYKLSARFNATESLAFRGTVSTGFRAPTPGQANVIRIITSIINGQLSESGVLPPTNPIASSLASVASGGDLTATPLEPEESFSWTIGTAIKAGPVDLTIDYFNINIEDRIALSSLIDIDRTDPAQAAVLAQLTAAGVPGASTFSAFQFFTNDFETTTQGVDVVATMPFMMGGGDSSVQFAFNWTDTELERETALADATRKSQLEDQLPGFRAVLTGTHALGPWRFLARASYYDSYIVVLDAYNGFDGEYGAEALFDAEVAYTIADKFTVTLGAQDLFDATPDKFPNAGDVGNEFPTSSPIGFNGGFWYARVNMDF